MPIFFTETNLPGAFVIELEKFEDDRGFFAENFNLRAFEKCQLGFSIAQCNIAFNKKRGTLRGMHFQIAPSSEIKLVQCIRGGIFDVFIDLRPTSPTYCKWASTILTAENKKQVYIPKGFAHGYQTLEDNTEVSYLVSEFYDPKRARGVRWNDPRFAIKWPHPEGVIIHNRDASYPDFRE